AACRAASVATVEAERAGRIATLPGGGRLREQLANGVEGADITGRVRPGRLADRALVDHDDGGDLLGAQQAGEGAGRFGWTAEMLEQGGIQHVLHQRGFAGTGHAGQAYQAAQREGDIDLPQVVRADALDDELW